MIQSACNLWFRIMVMRGAAVALVVAAPLSIVIGIAGPAQDTAKLEPAKMMAKDADPDWDVVAVKPDDPNSTQAGFWLHDRGLEIKGKTAQQLLLYGYGLHESQALNAPGWMRTERWHVEGVAGVPGQPNREQMGSLVRKLLAERFGLVMHHDQREMRVFALAVAKGGPKMAPSADDPNAPMH